MLLIDQPYVSDFLLDTLRQYRFPVIATPAARAMVQDSALNWMDTETAVARLQADPAHLLYSISENGLDWLARHLPDSARARQVQVLKDKVQFRELCRSLFPDFFFREVRIDELQSLAAADLPFPFVIKPSIGFFSIGVHIVRNEDDWQEVKQALQPEQLQSIFPASVLDTGTFIMEEFIEGEEYAVDYYYDGDGKVVVLNVLHHLFSSGTDTSDRVYTTSKQIITRHRAALETFLTSVGEQLQARNFPAHAEVRIDAQGRIQPIEINPLRFGGWCTSGDLLGLALGLNAYDYFFHQKVPDWDALFRGKEEQLFSIIVLNNTSGIAEADISGFAYAKLAADLEHPVAIRPLDIQKYGIFGFAFTETSPQNRQELARMLTADLREYIIRS